MKVSLLGVMVSPIVLLAVGCGGSGGGGGSAGGTPPPTGGPEASMMYVTQGNTFTQAGGVNPNASDEIFGVSATATGQVAPSTTLMGPMGLSFQYIATDPDGNLYVTVQNFATFTNPEILEYAAGATGAATPLRTITGSNTGLSEPTGIAVDAAGTIYVIDNAANGISPAVLVYAAGTGSNVAPTRTIRDIMPPQSGLDENLAVDASGNVYTIEGAPNQIAVYSSTANGSVAPTRTLNSTEITLQNPYAVAVDAGGNVYVACSDASLTYAEVAVFAPTASGTTPPTRILGGTVLGFQSSIGGLDVDAKGYVFGTLFNEPVFPTSTFSLISYAPSAAANTAPLTQVSVTGLTAAGGGFAIH